MADINPNKKSKFTVTAETSNIPHELIVEILSRIPAKSLIRFRCVCKPWCDLTLNPNFTKLHLNRATERDDRDLIFLSPQSFTKEADITCESYIHCLQGDSFRNSMKLEDPLGLPFESSKLLGSCNGIICLGMISSCTHRICLVNPYTREYKIVKFESGKIRERCDAYGFGFDDFTDNYKFVQVFDYDNKCDIWVYSVNDASCSQISEIRFDFIKEKKSGVFLDGAIYWVVRDESKCFGPQEIISFDVGTNVVQLIPGPVAVVSDKDMAVYSSTDLTLGVIGGQLSVFRRFYTFTEVWVRRKNDSGDLWCRVFSTKEQLPMSFMSWKLLYFSKDAEVLTKHEENLVMFDVKKRTARTIPVQSILNRSRLDKVMTHVPSLISLKSKSYLGSVTVVVCEDQAQ